MIVTVPSWLEVWSVSTQGGWTGHGCLGDFYHVADPSGRDWIEWAAPLPERPMDCGVSIYIPDSAHAAGQAQYCVWKRAAGQAEELDVRTVEQSQAHAEWIGLGPYPVSGGDLAVRVEPAGPPYKEITAGAAHPYCTEPGQL